MSTLRSQLHELSTSRVTPMVLHALDAFVPGEWEDLTSLEDIAAEVTGESDAAVLRRVGDRVEALYADPDNPYRNALRLYSAMDTLDRVAAGAVLASKVGERVSMLSFLSRVAPRADTVQAVDAATKLAAELAAFSLLHGLPSASVDGVREFAGALGEYTRAEGMRLAAWVVIDGIIPLGPNFIQLITEQVGEAELADSRMFAAVREWLPGQDDAARRGFLMDALASVSGWVEDFVSQHNITAEGVGARLSQLVDAADASSEILAAVLDTATSYFRHTGTQTVARYAIQEAWEQVAVELAEEAAEDAARAAEEAAAAAAGPRDEPREDDRGGPPPPWLRRRPPGPGPGWGPPRRRGPGRRRRRGPGGPPRGRRR